MAKLTRSALFDTTKDEGDDFEEDLAGLDLALVNATSYQDAIAAARAALPDAFDGLTDEEAANVIAHLVGHVGKYAGQVPARIASRLEAALAEIRTAPNVGEALAAQLEAFRSSVTRYAGVNWRAGQEAYGRGLDKNTVYMIWQAEDDGNVCDDCLDLEAEGPYSAEDIPTWPCGGETICLDNCRCTIEADRDSWDAATGN